MNADALKILLHYHCSNYPYTDAVYAQHTDELISMGLIEMIAHNKCGTTPRGKAFVAMLCQTPLPEAEFVDPREKFRTPKPGEYWPRPFGVTIAPPKVGLEPDLPARCRHCGRTKEFHTLIGSFCTVGVPTFDPTP